MMALLATIFGGTLTVASVILANQKAIPESAIVYAFGMTALMMLVGGIFDYINLSVNTR